MALVDGPPDSTALSLLGAPGLAYRESELDYTVIGADARGELDGLDADQRLLPGHYGEPTATLDTTENGSCVYWVWDCQVDGSYIFDADLSVWQRFADRANLNVNWVCDVSTSDGNVTWSISTGETASRKCFAGTRYYFRVRCYSGSVFPPAYVVLRISEPAFASQWYQPPSRRLAWVSPFGYYWNDGAALESPDGPIDLVIEGGQGAPPAGSGAQAPIGTFTWARAFNGPRPQDKKPQSSDSAWDGARRNINNGLFTRWDDDYQTEYTGDPAGAPASGRILKGGVDSSSPYYSLTWSTQFSAGGSNASLTATIRGVRMFQDYQSLEDAAGPLADLRTSQDTTLKSPSDPAYDGVFVEGAQTIEFEAQKSLITDYKVGPDEYTEQAYTDFEITVGPLDEEGVDWCFVTEAVSAEFPPNWGWFNQLVDPDYPDEGYSDGFTTDGTGTAAEFMGRQQGLGVFKHGDTAGEHQWYDVGYSPQGRRSAAEFVLYPQTGQDGAAPTLPNDYGDSSDGGFSRDRRWQLLASLTVMQPSRIRAVYEPAVQPASPDYPTLPEITGEIGELRRIMPSSSS